MFELNGRVAVVTGASSGLGKSAASAFAAQGADVVLLARREDRLLELKETLEKEYGHKVLAIGCDVSQEEEVKKAIDKVVASFGQIDILLNNAGVAVSGGVDTLTDQDWQKIFDVNVLGISHVSKYVVPVMQKNHYGRIINTASINAVVMDKVESLWRHAYNATKAAVVGLTKGMAASYGVDGITVNAVGPGLFETEMTADTLFQHEQFMTMYNGLVPLSRPGKQGELNGPILFFASEESSYVTGQLLLVDGGFSII